MTTTSRQDEPQPVPATRAPEGRSTARPAPEPAQPWWAADGRLATGPAQDRPTLATANVMAAVERVRSWIPTWRRTITAVLTQATKATDAAALQRALAAAANARSDTALWSPQAACAYFAERDQVSEGLVAREAVGEQAELLVVDLGEADSAWPTLCQAPDDKPDFAAVAGQAQHALAALQSTLQHALMLTFLGDSTGKRIGSACDFDDYCNGWDLTPAQIAATWVWLSHDPWVFGGRPLPLVMDTAGQHRVYRKAPTWSLQWSVTTLSPLAGAALVYGLVAALFGLLHQAGLTQWPSDWPVKLFILVVFVALGAVAHVASRSLSAISYDDPLQVYVAGQALDWLSLRWLAIVRAYIPILIVAVTLWGAGNIPVKFQDLATALLSGYSADSLFQAGLSKLKSQASGPGAKATPPAAGPHSTAAPSGAQTQPGGSAAGTLVG